MALRDELDRMQIPKPQTISDEEVYRILISRMYRYQIVEPIKREVAKGKTQIEGSFTLSYGTICDERFPSNKLENSQICIVENGYDGDPDSFRFKPLYTYKNGFFKTTVSLTPLGERVYRDLKRLAQNDQVFLSEPTPKISSIQAYGKGSIIGSMIVKFSYRYK